MASRSQIGPSSSARRCDALVIGGGPGGSTAAALLCAKGWQVVLLEKDRHPRFHIGESLLPMNLPILERLGVLEQVRSIGVPKLGAEFGGADGGIGDRLTMYFRNAMDKAHPLAYQVRRSEFDELLIRNAARKGVEVHEGVRVTRVDLGGKDRDRTIVSAQNEQGASLEWQARFVVDASGRDTFLARQLGLKRKNPHHQSAAVFGHFRDVVRRPGEDAGNIGIYWFEHGWFWMIPLRDGVTSVGAVCWPEYLKTRSGSLEAFLHRTIDLCPEVKTRMANAAACDTIRATGNYSYRARRMAGDGYILVGDAFAFIDPVFSTGVFLSMNSAVLGAEAVDGCLRDPAAQRRLLRRYERRVRRGLDTVSWFIYRFTTPAMRHLFMHPRNIFRVEEALISLLAGDVFRKTPIGPRLALFKAVYWLNMVSMLGASWSAFRLPRRNVAERLAGDNTSRATE